MLKLPLQDSRQQAQLDWHWQTNCLRPDYRAELRYMLRRYYRIILLAALAALALATFYVLTTPKLYTAHVQVLLDPRIPTPLPNEREENRFAREFDNPEVESQLQILNSARILQAVVDKLKLYENPEFVAEPGGTIQELIEPLIERVTGEATETANQAQAQLATKGPDPADVRAAVEYLREGLDIERVKLSYVLDISFVSLDPSTAAKVANAIANTYIEDQLTTSSQIASQGAKWLEDRIDQLRKKLNEASYKLQEFRAKRSDSAPEQTTLDELESTTAAYRKIYEGYLQAYIDSAQRQALPAGIARIVNYANTPVSPSYPRKGKILLGALFLGLLAGYGVAALRNLFDNTIRSPRTIEKAGIAYLGELRGLTNGQKLRMVPDEPLSQFSYDVRRLERTLSARRARPFQSIGVAPISPGIATSEVALNLAYLNSFAGKSVLLVDADQITRRVTQALGANDHKGLADLLEGNVESGDCIVAGACHGIDLLPAGSMTSEQLNDWAIGAGPLSEHLKPVLDRYDVVVFDLPPAVNPATLSLAHLAEAIVIVTKFGSSQLPLVSEFTTAFESRTGKFVGVSMAFNR